MGQRGAAQPDGGGLELGRHAQANLRAFRACFKAIAKPRAAALVKGMTAWLTDFWSHLHTAEGLRQTIEVGGLGLMCLIIFAETGLLVGFFLPGDSLLVTAGVLSVANGGRPAYFQPWELTALLTLAAIVGDQTGH
jgi:hypothetical protein